MRIGNTIYLDHQASTPVDSKVLAAMTPFAAQTFANPHAADHAMGWEAGRAVEQAAQQVAQLLGGDADEIVFTSGATESNNLALLGLCEFGRSTGRTHVLALASDHKSVLATGRALSKQGLQFETVHVDAAGMLDVDDLRAKLSRHTLLLSAGLVNSEIGTIQNRDAVRRLTESFGVLLHWDAAQAPCAMDLHELAWNADLISLSAHKMYGPKGIGSLYIRRDLHDRITPLIHGGGQQSNLRAGTLPVALCVGFGNAAKLIAGEYGKAERDRQQTLRDLFVDRILAAHDAKLNGPHRDVRHPGNANIRFHGCSGHDLLAALQPRLAASMGSACASGIPEPSHVLRAVGLSAEEAETSIRFSLGRFTTEEDVAIAVELIAEALQKLSHAGMSRAHA